MAKLKEIILFCYGDSRDASVWSNVPYLMARAFEQRGIKVDRVDISLHGKWVRMVNRLFRVTGRSRYYDFTRTRLYAALVGRLIKRAVSRYSSADFCLFLNFEFYNRYSSVPSLLFSDWTYRMLFSRSGEKPTRRDLRFMDAQRRAVEAADIVLPMFSESYDMMVKDYPGANVCRVEGNVINIMSEADPDADDLIARKLRSRKILFIGRPAYRAGLELLMSCMASLGDSVELHVIGMTRDDVGDAPDNVTFHGFLHKDNREENALYYSLLGDARVVVNPTERWGSYSSIVEAMYFYTPIVVAPYNQFVKEFGADIDFGVYNTDSDSATLTRNLRQILDMPADRYRPMCLNAHSRVAHYTWDRYVGKMTEMMEAAISKKD